MSEPNCTITNTATYPNGIETSRTIKGPISALQDALDQSGSIDGATLADMLKPGYKETSSISCDGEVSGPPSSAPPTPSKAQGSNHGKSR